MWISHPHNLIGWMKIHHQSYRNISLACAYTSRPGVLRNTSYGLLSQVDLARIRILLPLKNALFPPPPIHTHVNFFSVLTQWIIEWQWSWSCRLSLQVVQVPMIRQCLKIQNTFYVRPIHLNLAQSAKSWTCWIRSHAPILGNGLSQIQDPTLNKLYRINPPGAGRSGVDWRSDVLPQVSLDGTSQKEIMIY
jgi:hypothetical protein